MIAIPEDDEGPSFAYSVGFYETLREPEVILFGLDPEDMFAMINGIGERIKEGDTFSDLDESGDVLDDYNVLFRTVDRKHYREYFGSALWFYQGETFPAIQCVWPDNEHRYPWHPTFPKDLAKDQPMLFDAAAWPFQAGKNRAVFTTKPVVKQGLPVLLVTHGEDGDWQFLCGTTNETTDGQVVRLGTMLNLDPTLAQMADLPEGWSATRKAIGAQWKRESSK
jgi:hypothetical protein